MLYHIVSYYISRYIGNQVNFEVYNIQQRDTEPDYIHLKYCNPEVVYNNNYLISSDVVPRNISGGG
jgi:hypothetical protein